MENLSYLSLFSGIGGFELGIQQAYEKLCIKNKKQRIQGVRNKKRQSGELSNISTDGLTCIGYSEIDKYAVQIYQKHFNHKNHGDITKINVRELPEFQLLVGGFPCQSFSIAGKRGGFDDTRGTLFFDIARILQTKKPRLFLLENVKGLLSHDNGFTFRTIIATLDELGYDLQWQVLNSKNFGVPQNRERVFIIGHLRETSRPQVFPFGESNSNIISGNQKRTDRIADSITTRYAGRNGRGTHLKQILGGGQGNRVYDSSGISTTIASQVEGRGAKTGLYNLEDKIRRLTPTECERLQGFPDGWTEGLSDTQRYKTLGNAVTVNVIQEIMKKLLTSKK